jgi:hypothetical protein
MGTNYYLHRNLCRHCGRSNEPMHIGKSSAGWCFALHVIPELGINDLPDWQREWETGFIKDEYGDALDATAMLRVITERRWRDESHWDTEWWIGYRSEVDFHVKNYSERGPNGLLRHQLGRWCVGHGAGTWDLMPGEFS